MGVFTKDGAVQDQIAASIDDAVGQIRCRITHGESKTECCCCGEQIPEARRKAVPGVRLCIVCQQEQDAEQRIAVGYNRRGSLDSQLR